MDCYLKKTEKLFTQYLPSKIQQLYSALAFFFLDINTKIHILRAMKPIYRKRITWIIMSVYLMLTPVPIWNNGNLVMCLADYCQIGIAFAAQEDHCKPGNNSCRESSEYAPQLSDSNPDECFCCIEIPISNYIQENTPLSRPNDPSGGVQNVLAQSLPDSHPLLNKALFSPSPNPHIISTQKALRSVILII